MGQSDIKNIDIIFPRYSPGYTDHHVQSIMKATGATGATSWLVGQEPWAPGSKPVAVAGNPDPESADAVIFGDPRDVNEGAQWVASQMGRVKSIYAKVGFLVNKHVGLVDSGSNPALAAKAAEESWSAAGERAHQQYLASPQKAIDDTLRAAESAKAAFVESAKANEVLAIAKAGGDLSRSPVFYNALGEWVVSLDGAPKSHRLAEVASALEAAGFKSMETEADFASIAGPRAEPLGSVGQVLAALKKGNTPWPVAGEIVQRCAATCQDPHMLAKLSIRRQAKAPADVAQPQAQKLQS